MLLLYLLSLLPLFLGICFLQMFNSLWLCAHLCTWGLILPSFWGCICFQLLFSGVCGGKRVLRRVFGGSIPPAVSSSLCRLTQTCSMHTMCWTGFISLDVHQKISAILKLWFSGSSNKEHIMSKQGNKKSSLGDSGMGLKTWMMRECNLNTGNWMDKGTGGRKDKFWENLHFLVHCRGIATTADEASWDLHMLSTEKHTPCSVHLPPRCSSQKLGSGPSFFLPRQLAIPVPSSPVISLKLVHFSMFPFLPPFGQSLKKYFKRYLKIFKEI